MILGLNHVTLAVTDINRSFHFYNTIIGLKPLVKWDKGAYFLMEDKTWFCLNLDDKRIPSSCYTHYAFTLSSEAFDNMVERALQAGCVTFKENTSPGESFYFLDPDGHKLEFHCGTYEDRIAAKQADIGNWKNVEWFI